MECVLEHSGVKADHSEMWADGSKTTLRQNAGGFAFFMVQKRHMQGALLCFAVSSAKGLSVWKQTMFQTQANTAV